MLVEGNWIWDGDNINGGPQFWMGTSNGNPVGGLYNNWGNEPDDFLGQDALGLSLNGWPLGVASEWNDVDHTNTLYFIIEHPGILCTSTFDTINPVVCDSYTSPSGNVWTTSNTYSDTIQNALGCDSIISINLTVNVVDTSVTVNSLSSLSSNAVNATYQWLDCNSQSILVGDTNQTLIAITDGDYAVIVTQNGCTDTSKCFSIAGIGLNAFYAKSHLKVYPNPSKGNLLISTPNIGKYRLEIRSLTGKLVYHNKEVVDQQLYLELELESGTYIIQITGKEDVFNRKLLID